MIPTQIILHQQSKTLEIHFDNGENFILSCEYLRVSSPSAETRRAGEITGKENVNIVAIEPVGNYAIKCIFDDGHSSGIYSWETLYELGMQLSHSRESGKLQKDSRFCGNDKF